MEQEAADSYCTEVKAKSALPRIISKGYHALNVNHEIKTVDSFLHSWNRWSEVLDNKSNHIYVFKEGTLAPQAAGVIHTDFEKGFICADIYTYADFMECKLECYNR